MRNNNRKIIRRLSVRSLRQSRVRNRIAILAIILTSLLFSGIFTFMIGVGQIAEEETMREVGTRTHAGLKNVTWKQMERITGNTQIKSFSWNIYIGTAENVTTRQSELRYASGEDELENSFIELEEGTMPKERSDLIADTIVLEALGAKPEIGAQVPIEFEFQGKHHSETFTLCGWYRGDYVSHASELYLSESYWKELRGTLTDEDFAAWGKTHPEGNGEGLYNVNIWFGSSRGIEERMRAVIEEAGYEPEEEINYGINWAYMSSRMENLDPFQIGICVSALLVVIFTGYLIIHNIFQISIMGDIRFYGLLKTVGTTGKQIRKLVRRQAWILSAVGIPAGLFLGFILGKLLFPLALGFLDMKGMQISVSFEPWIFVFGALFSLATVYVSCRKPAKIAGRISPVEAVRYTGMEISGSRSRLSGKRKRILKQAKRHPVRIRTEESWNSQNALRTEEKRHSETLENQKRNAFTGRIPRMALANLGRSKAKTCAVILSMTFSIILLSFVLTAMHSFRLDSYIETRLTGDFLLANTNLTGTRITADMSLDKSYIAEADKQKGITDRNEIWVGYGVPKLRLNEKAREKFAALDEQGLVYSDSKFGGLRSDIIERIKTGEYGISLDAYAYTPGLLEQISVLEGTIDAEKFQSGNYVLAGEFYGNTHTGESLYHVGDRISIPMVTEDSEYNYEEDEDGNVLYWDMTNSREKEYEVMAVVNLPHSMMDGGYTSNSLQLVLPLADMKEQEQYEASQLLAVSYDVEPEHREAFEGFLKQYTKNVNTQMGYLSADVLRAEFSSMQQSIGLIGVAMAAVIALVGILNFLNAILTGIQARRHEFAMLQSIGLTGKQLIQLLVCEGLYYALISGVLGVVLGSAAGYFAVSSLEQMIMFFQYRFTALPYLVLLPVFLAASVLLPYLACRKLEKASIVERLREAET